jgi:pectate lyase
MRRPPESGPTMIAARANRRLSSFLAVGMLIACALLVTVGWASGAAGHAPSIVSGNAPAAPGAAPTPAWYTYPHYTVTFTETGLASGTAWSVILGGVRYSTNLTSLSPSVRPGPYWFQALPVAGYSVSPGSASILVEQNYLVALTFVSTAVPNYTVTFAETGLASGTLWTVNFGGLQSSTNGTNLTVSVPRGPYFFQVLPVAGYSVSPGSASIMVAQNYLVNLTFSSAAVSTYTVTFAEAGLAAGTLWTVNFGGVQSSTNGTNLSTSVAPGPYWFQVLPVAGYSVSPGSASISVEQNYLVTLTFTATAATNYTVMFMAAGLPAGTSWTAILGGVESNSSGASIAFSVPAGTYSYQVIAPGGFAASPAAGTATVGSGYIVAVSFTASSLPPPPPVQVSVGWLGEGLAVAIGLGAAALGFAVAAVLLGRRSRPAAGPAPLSAATAP